MTSVLHDHDELSEILEAHVSTAVLLDDEGQDYLLINAPSLHLTYLGDQEDVAVVLDAWNGHRSTDHLPAPLLALVEAMHAAEERRWAKTNGVKA